MTSILRSILSEMLDAAEKNPGDPVRNTLSRGLQIDVKIDNGRTCLQISRSGEYPSDKEWETVLKSWPYPVQVSPKTFAAGVRKYLQAEWPTQPRLI